MRAKLILTVQDSVTAHQLSLLSVYFNNYSQRFPQIVTAAAVVKLRHTSRHSTYVSTGFRIIGRHKILCDMLDYIGLVNKHILTKNLRHAPVMFHRQRYGHCRIMCTTSDTTAICHCDLQWTGSECKLFILKK